MSRSLKTAVAVVMVLALLVSAFGCTSEAPAAPTTAPAAPGGATAAPAPAQPTAAPAATTPAAAPTTAAAVPAGEVIELKYHHHDPPQSFVNQNAHMKFAELINQKTNGRVKITVYPGETLGKSGTALDMAQNGIADISWGFTGQFPGRFPVTDILSLPMLGLQTGPQGSKVVWEMFKKSPDIQKEWADFHVLLLHTTAPHRLAFGTKKVTTMEDMKGARLRSLAGAPLKYLQALGANPVTVPAPESFEAIQKGTIDGASFDWNGIGSFRLEDICKYVLEEDFYPSTFFLVMNKKVWEGLPADIQQVFNEVAGDAGSVMYGQAWEDGSANYKKTGLEKGVEVVKLSDAERERWIKAAQPVWDEYVKVANSKGADGQALLEQVQKLYADNAPKP